MKISQVKFIVIVLAVSLLLTACSALPVPNYPGTAASQDTIYVAYTGFVIAVNPVTQSQIWRYPAQVDPARQFFAPPAVAGDLVIVGSMNNSLYALDKSTGSEKWVFAEAKGKWIAGALFANDLILAPNSDGNLYALTIDGRVKWKFTAKAAFWAAPVSDGKTVYLPSLDHFLYAITIASGQPVWSLDLSAGSLNPAVLGNDGTLYLSTLENKVIAVNSGSGRTKWTFAVGGNLWGAPVLFNEKAFVADQTSKVYAINIGGGSSAGQWDAPGPVAGTGVALENGVVFVTESGDIFGITDSGSKFFNQNLSNQKINGKLYTTPIVYKDQVILSLLQGDKILVSYDAKGNLVWSLDVPK